MEGKTKLIFVNSYKKSIVQNYNIFFEYNGQKLSDKNHQKKKLPTKDENFSFFRNELIVNEDWIQEENELSNIKLLLNLVEIDDEKIEPMKYETNIYFEKNRTNFIFGFKIGNLINKKHWFQSTEFEQRNTSFNFDFSHFHKYTQEDLNNINFMIYPKKIESY